MENRRLLIEPKRLRLVQSSNNNLKLLQSENHYIRRVLRLKVNDEVDLIDGIGNLWKANLVENNFIKLQTNIDEPFESKGSSKPLICLAVVLPKRGFDEMLRMTCEIGVDIIQPLKSNRSNFFSPEPRDRWENIIKESIELSERLWKPSLLETIDINQFFLNKPKNSTIAMALTRNNCLKTINAWVDDIKEKKSQIWIFIGPEGGWTQDEIYAAQQSGLEFVQLGESILRTSTACVVAIQSINSSIKSNERINNN